MICRVPTVVCNVRSKASRWRYALQLGVVLTVLAVSLAMMSVSDAVNGGSGAKAFLVGRMALLILVCTWFLRRGGERWADLGLRRPPRWWVVPLLVVGGFAAVVTMSSFMVNSLLPALDVPPPKLGFLARFDGSAEFLFFLIAVAWGSAAFGEEMLLRGFVLDRISKLANSSGTAVMVAAIFLQGPLFGLFHLYQGLGGVLVTSAIGIIFGFVWLIGGRNLWACIVLHGLINTISFSEAYSRGPAAHPPVVQQNSAPPGHAA